MNKNKNNDRHYRRGIVLGLTFAELLMLLLFVVLLVLGASLKGKNNSNEKQYDEKKLSEMSALPTSSTEDELLQLNQLVDHIKNSDPTAYAKIKRYIIAGEIEKAYPEIIESSLIVKTYMNMISDCRTQNKHLVQLKNVGRGGDFPSCWFDENGAKQFIYNIDLTDKGIIVHDNPIPSREEEKKILPLKDFKLGTPMQPNEFIRAGQKIKKLSDDNSCRFFVKIADKTSPQKKEHYKKLRNTVENIFYKKDV